MIHADTAAVILWLIVAVMWAGILIARLFLYYYTGSFY